MPAPLANIEQEVQNPALTLVQPTNRPVTRFVSQVNSEVSDNSTAVSDSLPDDAALNSADPGNPSDSAIYKPCAPGKIINQQYRIDEVVGTSGRMNCYLVSVIHSQHSWCGQCGEKIEVNEPYCPVCGYALIQNQLTLFDGDRVFTNGYKHILEKNLSQDGLLQVLDRFHFEDRYFVLTPKWEGATLATIPQNDFVSRFNWLLVIGGAVEYLHAHQIYHLNLTPQNIYIRSNGPKVAGLGQSKEIKYQHKNTKKTKRYQRKDMLAFCRLLQKFTAQSTVSFQGSGLFSVIKEIASDAIQGKFQNMNDLLQALRTLKKDVIQPPVPVNMHRVTRLLNRHGTKIIIGKSSDRGIVRNLNEDSVATYEFTSILESVSMPISLCVVADGMGGHQNGEIASRIAIQQIAEYVNQKLLGLGLENLHTEFPESEIKKILTKAIQIANEKVHQIARAKSSDMGATLVAALIIGQQAYFANVGDCRAYHLNNRKLKLVTHDHSLVFRLFKNQQIGFKDIRTHPQRHQVLRCLGEPNLMQNLTSMAQNGNHPFWFTQKLAQGDTLLLCSDGLWEMVPETILSNVIENYDHPQSACDALVKLANKNGGEDNISVIILKMT